MNWGLAVRRSALTLAVGLVLIAGGVCVSQCGGLPSWAVPFVEPPPFACEGLHALVVEDEDGRRELASEAIAAFEGADVVDWTSEHARQFLVLDKDTDKTNLSAKWLQEAWKSYEEKSKGKLPWVVISNGKTGTSEALPGNPTATIELLKKYGEP